MEIDNKMGLYEISNQHTGKSQSISEKIGGKSTAGGQRADGGDSTGQDVVVQLSQTTREVQLAQKVIAAEPAVREEKVAEIKQKIQSGNYPIDHQAVAGRLVSALFDDIV